MEPRDRFHPESTPVQIVNMQPAPSLSLNFPQHSSRSRVLVSTGGDTSNAVTIAIVGSESTGFSGNWTFSAQSSLQGFQSGASGVLTQNGNSVSGQLNLSGTPCATPASVSGTVSWSALSMTLNENGQLVKFTGTVSADENSASSTYVTPSGGCDNGDYGT